MRLTDENGFPDNEIDNQVTQIKGLWKALGGLKAINRISDIDDVFIAGKETLVIFFLMIC